MRRKQTGISTIVVALLLIAGVLFVVTQSLDLSRTRSVDTAQDSDSSRALMVAESGIRRADAIITTEQGGGTFDSTTCNGIATGAPFTVGGTLTYGTAVPDPANCVAGECNSCTVTAIGKVNSAERSVTAKFDLGSVYGVTGRGTVVRMVLKNIHTVPALAMFNLAWRRHGQGGNAKSTLTPCTGCTLTWNLESSSGNPSVGDLGTIVPIGASVSSQPVVQTISQSRDYVEVGGLFPGVDIGVGSTAPTLIGSFWSDDNNGDEQTRRQNNSDDGYTTSGVAATNSAACLSGATVPNPPGNTTEQTCRSWCHAGDTLVFGLAGRSDAAIDQTTSATFNTTGTNSYPAQNVPLVRLVHFPNTDGSTAAATGKLYSEIFWAYNPAYAMTAGVGAGASSFPRSVVGSVGGEITLSQRISNGDTALVAASVSGEVCVGDAFNGGIAQLAGKTITSHPTGTSGCSSSSGTYGLSSAHSGGQVKTDDLPRPTVTSVKLKFSGKTGADFAAGATNSAGVTIASGPVGNDYALTTAAYVAPGVITQGTTSNTIYVPTGAALPLAGTRLQVYSHGSGGSGLFAANTTVNTVGAGSFTITTTGTADIKNAVLCGGTCAMFNEPASTTSTTRFTIAKSANTSQWAGGFVCMSGVDAPNVRAVSSAAVKNRTWSEPIQ